MYSDLIQYFHNKDELGKLVILDLLDEIIELGPKYRLFKQSTHKKVLEGKFEYIFPIAANESLRVNGITFFTKKIHFNKALREYGSFGDQNSYYQLIRHNRYMFMEMLVISKLIEPFELSKEAKEELKGAELEELYSIKGDKAFFEIPRFRFFEKGFSVDDTMSILYKDETKPLLLIAQETDKLTQSIGRSSLEETGRSGIYLEELESITYEFNQDKLEKLRDFLTGSDEFKPIRKCSFGDNSLYINGDEMKFALKAQLFIELIGSYFQINNGATQVDEGLLLDYYVKNRERFVGLDKSKLNYKNILNGYLRTINDNIKRKYFFEDIITIEQKERSFTIKLEKVFR